MPPALRLPGRLRMSFFNKCYKFLTYLLTYSQRGKKDEDFILLCWGEKAGSKLIVLAG